jgi:hypothetical protein
LNPFSSANFLQDNDMSFPGLLSQRVVTLPIGSLCRSSALLRDSRDTIILTKDRSLVPECRLSVGPLSPPPPPPLHPNRGPTFAYKLKRNWFQSESGERLSFTFPSSKISISPSDISNSGNRKAKLSPLWTQEDEDTRNATRRKF